AVPRPTRDRFDWRVRARVASSSPPDIYTGVADLYQDRFLKLLDAERAHALLVLRTRLAEWSLEKIIAEGFCASNLGGFWLERQSVSVSDGGFAVAAFAKGPGERVGAEKMEVGTHVLLTRTSPLTETPIEGRVIGRTRTQIKVVFADADRIALNASPDGGLEDGVWRLDVGCAGVGWDRMREAVGKVGRAVCYQNSVSLAEKQEETILVGTELRDVILRSLDERPPHGQIRPEIPGGTGAFSGDQRVQSWARRYARANPVVVEGDPVIRKLNETQVRAVAMMIGDRMSLVQGPPGTGKTRTIVEAVKLLKLHFSVPHPLLICTYTHTAVDTLVRQLVAQGLNVVRVGARGEGVIIPTSTSVSPTTHLPTGTSSDRPSRTPRSAEESTLEWRMMQHKEYALLQRLRGQAQRLEARANELGESVHKLSSEVRRLVQVAVATDQGGQIDGVTGQGGEHKDSKEIKRAKERLGAARQTLLTLERKQKRTRLRVFAVRMGIVRDVFDECDVICTTCITSASSELGVMDFPVVFLDEAGMATEPASLIPLMKGVSDASFSFGDSLTDAHIQGTPCCAHRGPQATAPVITSPEARAGGLGTSLFERLMHEGVVPSIMLDVQYRMHPLIARFPAREFYGFKLRDGIVGTNGKLRPPTSQYLPPGASVGFLNHGGAEEMRERSRANVHEATLVADVVADLLARNPELRGRGIGVIAPYAAQIALVQEILRSREIDGGIGVEVCTVDGFEGREKDVIIFSTVRNNVEGRIGFLADERRLNVGLTRAKRGLVVLGNTTTLGSGRVDGIGGVAAWTRYIKYLTENQSIIQM
ncbi:P-loop containing nucleoside triphosphate hydrolase protein, partial [Infundibulicybe gibba]